MMRWWVLALATLLVACARTKSSGVRTGGALAPYEGKVTIRASEVPPGAREVGVAQSYGPATIDELIPKFAERVAQLGGNFGKIDDIKTKFEMSTQTSNESYSCGTPSAPRTCYRTVSRQVEVATTTIVGRAFVVEGGK